MTTECKTAVIDLGTNTFHLLIADENGTAILKEKISVKIGQNGISQGMISEKAYQRAIKALSRFKYLIDIHQITKVYATATSAIRSAKNGKKLVKEIKELTGIPIQVISGEKEAEYIYHGVNAAMDLGERTSLIVDIGGGSVEFIIANKNEIFWKESFEIGAQRLVDNFHQKDPIEPSDIKKLNDFLEYKLQSLLKAIEVYKPEILVGSSGTFDTLAEIDTQEKGFSFQPDNEKEYTLSIENYKKLGRDIIGKDKAQRMLIPGMTEMRVDMIVVAICLIDFIIQKIKPSAIRVSTYSLKEGVLSKVLSGGLTEKI